MKALCGRTCSPFGHKNGYLEVLIGSPTAVKASNQSPPNPTAFLRRSVPKLFRRFGWIGKIKVTLKLFRESVHSSARRKYVTGRALHLMLYTSWFTTPCSAREVVRKSRFACLYFFKAPAKKRTPFHESNIGS